METADEDALLLRRFAVERSNAAFTALVARKIDLVYSAALRQVGGDPHLAAEVTQSVFISLARKAGNLREATTITGWLYQSTVFESKKLWRSQTRWRSRQHQAHAMHELDRTDTANQAWDDIRPLIDEAMMGLSSDDRIAVLARYFEGASYAAIGRFLRISENSARMRSERALNKLRTRLERRGVTSTASAFSAALAAGAVTAAPVALAGTVSTNVLALVGSTLAPPIQTLVSLAMKKQILVVTALAISAGSFFAGRSQALHERAGLSSPNLNVLPRDSKKPRPGDGQFQTSQQGDGIGTAAAPATAGPVPAIEALRVLIDLQKRGILKNASEIVRYGKVDPRFAALYGLNPEQTGAFQRILDSAHEKMAALTQANAKVTAQDSNHVVINVAPFPAEGGNLYDSTSASIGALLGPDRATAFQQLSLGSLENEFSGFGAAERTVTVTRTGSSDNPYSEIEDTWIQNNENGTTTASATYNLRTADDLSRLALGSALPPSFQQLPSNPRLVAAGSHTSYGTKGR